jgi:plasmid stability protein
MAQLLVRNLPDDVVAALKRRAAAKGRSVEAEHRAILEESLGRAAEDFWARAERLRAETVGRSTEDSTDIIRAYRDRR